MKKDPIHNYATVEFDAALEKLKQKYDEEIRVNESLRKKIREFCQTDEIARRDAEIKDLWSRSLLVMSEEETKANSAFIHKHYEMHKPRRTGKYIYTLTETGVGTSIVIKCPICNEEEDITDVRGW